jgi:DMSO reductase family type II enzyme heme b subunit
MTRRLPATVLAAAVLGLPGAARAQGSVEAGRAVYAKHCSQCHGDTGGGDGPAAKFMYPRPRVFKDNSSYKFRTTPSGTLPLDQDLFDTITRGIPATAMPDFKFLTEGQRWDLVAFIKSLNADFADPDYVSDAVAVEGLAGADPPAASPETLARGAEVYTKNGCGKCHGAGGRGNGTSWPTLKDDWGEVIVPANLTNPETFRGGSTPRDVFRTITTGLNGTPMPAYGGTIALEDRWALVHYVVDLGPPRDKQRDETVVAVRVDALPADGGEAAWQGVRSARFRTLANVIEPPRLFWPAVEFVTVQAVYTDTALALRVQWDDRTRSRGANVDAKYVDRDTKVYLGTDHPDQLAIQFPAGPPDSKERPYFLLGDGKRGVNLWWWRGDADVTTERNAKGSGAVTDQPERDQTLTASVAHDDGRYTLVVQRALDTGDDKRDVVFAPDAFTPIALHVWDGDRGEVGARHALTTWYWLYLQPEVPRRAYIVPPAAFATSFVLLLGVVTMVRRRSTGGGERRQGPAQG